MSGCICAAWIICGNIGIPDQYCALGQPGGMAGVLPAVLRYGKACDEAVTEQLEPEGRQEYATALLYMAVDTTARRIFAAPVCFDEGDIKGRIRHI